MKTKHLIQALTAALLLAAAPAETHAASLLEDGDFDALPVGNAPNPNEPAGRWHFIQNNTRWEPTPEGVSIVPAPAGGDGNALRFSWGPNQATWHSVDLYNYLAHPVYTGSGQIVNVSFDVYVSRPDVGGVAVSLNGDTDSEYAVSASWSWGTTNITDLFLEQARTNNIGSSKFVAVPSYPKGVWQTVRFEIDLARWRYNFYWSEKGQPASVVLTNLVCPTARFSRITNLTIDRYSNFTTATDFYIDNIRVTTDPVITPVNADLVAASSTTLQLLNLQTDSAIQWQFNGADLANATNATLELSGVTTNHSGSYRVVVTAGGEVVTTDPSTVRVFDQLTITTPPQSVVVLPGKTTGFSVTVTGPLPVTYQWQRNGADLPGKTNRFLTLTGVQLAEEGDYTVVVSDANGSVVSQPATVKVLIKPVIVQAPLSQSVVAGGSVTFSAEITGNPAPFTYQWRKVTTFANSTVLTEVQSAGKTAFFTLHNVQPADAGTYRLYLANLAAPDLTSTSPNRSFTLTVLPDTDGDGLPDEWETANGLNPNDPSDATTDADTDGLSNVAEYRSGTSPTNAASGLKLESVASTNGQAVVSFSAAALKTYTVEWSDQPSGGSWQKLSDVAARWLDTIATVTDSNAVAPSRFYRIVTPRRP